MNIAWVAALLLWGSFNFACAASKYTMPDIDQDSSTCFAAAASNVIYWLGQNGYPNILVSPSVADATISQRELITQIMVQCKTTFSKGTQGANEISGLTQFFKDHGYQARVTARGLDSNQPLNDLHWFEKNANDNVVFILCMAFVKKGAGHQYTADQDAGHAVSLLSYSHEVAVIHDSAHESGELGRRTFRFTPVSNATIRAKEGSETVPLVYELDGMRLPPDTDAAILDEAICIEMPLLTLVPTAAEKK